MFNPNLVNIYIITHDLGDNNIMVESGDRNDLLNDINMLTCGEFPNGDETDYDGALFTAYDSLSSSIADEQKIVVISFDLQ